MEHVHSRTEKKQIYLNARFQAVSENRKARSELGSFLGTTVRQFVPVTCSSWHEVPQKDLMWHYVKVKHVSYCEILSTFGLYVFLYALYVIFYRTSIPFRKRVKSGF